MSPAGAAEINLQDSQEVMILASQIGPPKTGNYKKKDSITMSPMKSPAIPNANEFSKWNVGRSGIENSEEPSPNGSRKRPRSSSFTAEN